MSVIYQLKERRVIPNWRDFNRTLQLNELTINSSTNKPLKIEINRALDDWSYNKNIGTAADLITSAFVSGINNHTEVAEALEFIKSNNHQSSPPSLACGECELFFGLTRPKISLQVLYLVLLKIYNLTLVL